MPPGVGPCSVRCQVAYFVILEGSATVTGQQIAPTLGIVITVGYGICGCSKGPGGVSILLTGYDVTGIIVGPGVGVTLGLVILPDQ